MDSTAFLGLIDPVWCNRATNIAAECENSTLPLPEALEDASSNRYVFSQQHMKSMWYEPAYSVNNVSFCRNILLSLRSSVTVALCPEKMEVLLLWVFFKPTDHTESYIILAIQYLPLLWNFIFSYNLSLCHVFWRLKLMHKNLWGLCQIHKSF